MLDVSPLTVTRHLKRLVDAGLVQRLDHGHYGLADLRRLLPITTQELVEVLERAGVEAHVTGVDVVGAHGHQLVRAYPHLVYVDPPALEELASQLGRGEFLAAPSGSDAATILLASTDPDRVVLLRGQPAGRMDRFGVRGVVAPVEKAWLDLLREARAGAYPVSLGDVGAIMASLERSGVDERLLLSWAREMGYGEHAAAALKGEAGPGADSELRELAAGARR